MLRYSATLALLIVLCCPAQCGDVTWTSDASGYWHTSTNWSSNPALPARSDDATIDRPSADPEVTHSQGSDWVRSLNCSEALVLSGGYIAVDYASYLNGAFTLSGGELFAFGPITWTGSAAWISGRIDGDGGVFNQGTATISGATSRELRALVTNTGVVSQSSDAVTFTYGGAVENASGGLWDITADCGLKAGYAGDGFTNRGTLRKSGGTGTSTVAVPFANEMGIIEALSGNLSFTGSGTSTGGTLLPAAGASISFTDGTQTMSGTYSGDDEGTVRLDGASILVPASGATLSLFPGGVDWSAGIIDGDGGLANTGLLQTSGSTSRYLRLALNNSGTIRHSSAGKLYFDYGGTLNNLAAGVFDIAGDTGVTAAYAGGDFNNSGCMRKSAGTGTAVISTPFNNTGGTVDVHSGILSLTGGGTSVGGTLTASPGAALEFTNGIHTMSGVFSGSVGGAVRFAGATIAPASTGLSVNFSGSGCEWTEGRIEGVGPFTNLGLMNIKGTVTKNLRVSLHNSGTISHSASGKLYFDYGGALTNEASGLFNIEDDCSVTAAYMGQDFTNIGVLRKATGAGTSTISVPLNNTGGTIQVLTGSLALTGGGVSSGGVFEPSTGASLDFANGAHTLGGSYSGTAGGAVRFNGADVTVAAGGAELNFSGGGCEWVSGIIGVAEPLNNVGKLRVTGTATRYLRTLLRNSGVVTQDTAGTFTLDYDGTLHNLADGVYDIKTDYGITGGLYGGLLSNEGILRKSGGSGVSTISTPLNNPGRVEVTSGTLRFTGVIDQHTGASLTGGEWAAIGSTIDITTGSNITSNAADITLSGSASSFPKIASLAASSGAFRLHNGRSFTTAAGFSNSGELELGSGSGAAGTMAVSGAYQQSASGALTVDIGGPTPGSGFWQLAATGAVSLDGALIIRLANGYTPAVGDTFRIIECARRTGGFTSVTRPDVGGNTFNLFYGDDAVILVFGPAAPVPCAADSVGRAKLLGPDTWVSVPAVVSENSDVGCYVQDRNGAAGIKVIGLQALPERGTEVTLAGRLDASNSELILADAQWLPGSGAQVDPWPVFLTCKSVGGNQFGSQGGVDGARGLNNIGLLVRTCGHVQASGSSEFLLYDGSGAAITCIVPAGTIVDPTWQQVVVTGVSSRRLEGAAYKRTLLVRVQPGSSPAAPDVVPY